MLSLFEITPCFLSSSLQLQVFLLNANNSSILFLKSWSLRQAQLAVVGQLLLCRHPLYQKPSGDPSCQL